MTNREWLMKEMQNMSDEEFLKQLDISVCEYMPKGECKLSEIGSCLKCQVDWLKAEHKEKPKLSDVERVILENVNKEYKWISRDDDGELAVFSRQPSKMVDGSGFWCRTSGKVGNIGGFNHLFQFIKWSDNEAYEISELLKGE